MTNAYDALLDLLRKKDPDIEERLKKYQEEQEAHKAHCIAKLREKCDLLGIIYTGDERQKEQATEIYRAADKVIACSDCHWTAADCDKCPYNAKDKRDEYLYIPHMPKCDKIAQWERNQKALADIQLKLANSGLGKRFLSRTFDTFLVSSETQAAYDTCREFCQNYAFDRQGLRLVGSYGSGKTHLAAAIVQELIKKGVGAMFVVVPELLQEIRKSYNTAENGRLMDIAQTAPLLVLDDLGAEKPSEWVQEQLYMIINRRYENILPTIITTNCTMKELADRVGQRTASRVVEMTDAVKIQAADYRRKLTRGRHD